VAQSKPAVKGLNRSISGKNSNKRLDFMDHNN